MLPKTSEDGRALFIQLARLGDLIQSLPAIEAVRGRYPGRPLDLLCSAPLAALFKKASGAPGLINGHIILSSPCARWKHI
jgi:ADP-heptose:LPS heptosyltransferase